MFKRKFTMRFIHCIFTIVVLYFPYPVSSDCVSARADIVFILDSSGSVGKSNFIITKNFFKEMVDGFNIGSDRVRMGSVTYSTRVHDTFQLNEFTSKDTLQDRIGRIPYDSGGTNTHRALKYARETSFQHSRSGVSKIVIVITDGKSNDKTETLEEARRLRNIGAIVFSIGVGEGVDRDELRGMASNTTYVFGVNTFNALRSIRERLTKTTCEVSSCGNPGNPQNGNFEGTDFSKDKSVTYKCYQDYRLEGDNTRTCQGTTWSGSLPRCIFVNACRSSPCKNNATCVNGDDSYNCTCNPGYGDLNCDKDIQPPVVEYCPNDTRITSSDRFVNITWKAPDFYDPINSTRIITISSNYPSHGSTFFWGDYTVLYKALKPSNGLRANCTFDITVRPYPCANLTAPRNGAVVCNGWMKEFTRLCIVFCRMGTRLSDGHDFRTKYVCGGSGNWLPTEKLPNCTRPKSRKALKRALTDEDENIRNIFRFNCDGEKDKMREKYLKILRNATGFQSLCDNHGDLCKPENVDVDC